MTPRERAAPVAGHGHPGQRVPPARSLPRRRTARGRGGGLRRRPAGCPRRNPCWCDRPVRASIDAGLLDPPDPRWPGTAGVRLPNRDCHHRGGREPTRPGGRGGRGLPVRSVAHNPPAEGTGPPRLCQRCGSGVTVSLGGLVVGRIDGDRGAGRGGCPTVITGNREEVQFAWHCQRVSRAANRPNPGPGGPAHFGLKFPAGMSRTGRPLRPRGAPAPGAGGKGPRDEVHDHDVRGFGRHVAGPDA